ncbi:hypothetical protein B5807_05572 [Epicoccum nigrum]|uniref:Uncharacterized protein n=1 Tax=Epicoccum nigrum TaxID=105696 RepID=A0A1Y2M0N0_EPING|nr:hypothetical protein B5807_05572 [Epicoccum nigrum]
MNLELLISRAASHSLQRPDLQSLPSNLPISPRLSNSTKNSSRSNNGLSTDASAGIGIGIALIVCLATFGICFLFARHRTVRRKKIRSLSGHSFDEEHIP